MANSKASLKSFIRRRLPPRILMRHIVSHDLKHGEPELLLLGLLCDKSSAMIDVGANLGVYSYVAAKYADRVYAIEPIPESAEWLRKTAPANVSVLEMAASDHEGPQTLYIPTLEGSRIASRASLQSDANRGAELKPIEITTAPLDSMDFGRVGFIKIDVEGHEQAVLRGAAGLIGRQRPAVQVECEERHASDAVASAVRFFAEFGYRGFFWKAEALRPIELFDPKRDQQLEKLRNLDDWHNRTYINNFLFLDPVRTDLLARLPLAALEAA
jgi:FkbM family methyltransferase